MKFLKILCIVIFVFIGCSDTQDSLNMPVVNDGTLIINPPVIFSGSNQYQVESAYMGMINMANKQIKGIIKVKYAGTTGVRYVYATITLYNKENVALFIGGSYISNITSCYSSDVSNNIWSFFTPQYNTGYVFINGSLNYFGLSALEDISRIEMSVESTPFTYQPPKGKFSVLGHPFKDKENTWGANIVNDGDRTIQLTMDYVKLLYVDSKNRLYNWSIPNNYEAVYWGDYITYGFDLGETVYFRGDKSNQNNLNEIFTCVQVCVRWY